MSWKPEDYSHYSFSEHTQPSERQEINYADPRFYQAQPEGGDTPHFSSPAYQPQPAPAPSQQAVMGEYRGPASLEHYTADAGVAQREAAQNGSVPAGNLRKDGLAGLGGLGAVLAFMAKFGLAGLTALLSIAVYAGLFGWAFGVGLVILLFIHEMGHAVVMKLKGIPIGGMIFIPMLGAAVFMSRMPQNARDEAEVGIAGPIAGALASSACLLLALSNPGFLRIGASLAYFGFLMNLLNLVPMIPFDGGRIMAAIDRRLWIIGLIGLVAFQVWEWRQGVDSPWLFIIIVMAVIQFWTRSRVPNTPEKQAYYAVSLGERIVIGLAYFGLAAALALGMSVSFGLMPHFR